MLNLGTFHLVQPNFISPVKKNKLKCSKNNYCYFEQGDFVLHKFLAQESSTS